MHAHAHDEEENLPAHAHIAEGGVPSMSDEGDIIFIKSHNTSAPNVRCRDQGAVAGLGTGAWAEEEELQGWIEVGSPPSTAVGKGMQGKVTSGFEIPGAVTTDRSQKRVTDYFLDTPSPAQLRERAQRLLDQRKEWQVAADGRQVQAFKVLREVGVRSMELQERAWKATAIQAELLRKQADDEQRLQDAINLATDQAQEATNLRRVLPRLPGCTGGTGAEWEGKARGYSGETRAPDLEECATCTGLFSTTRLWYLGGEMHCTGCYTSKGVVAPGGAGRHGREEQGHQGDLAVMIGAAVRETPKAASETSKDTTAKDSKLAALLATTIQPLNMKGGLIDTTEEKHELHLMSWTNAAYCCNRDGDPHGGTRYNACLKHIRENPFAPLASHPEAVALMNGPTDNLNIVARGVQSPGGRRGMAIGTRRHQGFSIPIKDLPLAHQPESRVSRREEEATTREDQWGETNSVQTTWANHKRAHQMVELGWAGETAGDTGKRG